MMVEHGRVYQMVTVPVRSPLPVAWIAMGFEFDGKAARELADITGLAVTLSVSNDGRWSNVVSTVPDGVLRTADVVTRRIELIEGRRRSRSSRCCRAHWRMHGRPSSV